MIKNETMCIRSFNQRKTLCRIRKNKKHYQLHDKDKKQFEKLTKFVYITKQCRLSDGSRRKMMLLIGEAKIQTISSYFKPKKTSVSATNFTNKS